MPRKKKPIVTRSTGIAMEVPVMKYLDQLVAEGKAKDRSALVNLVVREYAELDGLKLPPPEVNKEALCSDN